MHAKPLGRHHGRPSPEDIRAYLARLLAAPGFPASTRRRNLLEYLVEQTLAGQGDRLKAYDLAVAVLGRDERFDPQNDPIVRIEVGRLRRDLDAVLCRCRAADPIRITIPKGHYVPAFEARGIEPAAEPVAPARRAGDGWAGGARRSWPVCACWRCWVPSGALARGAPASRRSRSVPP